MEVKSITACPVSVPMTNGQRNARRTWAVKHFCFVFVELCNGITGVAEGWTSYASPEALALTIEDDLADSFVGQSVYEHPAFIDQARSSVVMSSRTGIIAAGASAIELAAWDAIGQLEQQPIHALLGTSPTDVPVYASAGLYADGKTPHHLGEELQRYVDNGFAAVKMKVGGASLAEDIARVSAAREAVGPDVDLMVDAHYTMDLKTAQTFAHAIERHNIFWFEAPLLPTDYDGYRELIATSPIPICGNETLAWEEAFTPLIDAGIHYPMFDLSICGGLGAGQRIAASALRRGTPYTLHSSSSAVLMAANLHLAATSKNCAYVEFHMMHRWLFDELGEGIFSLRDGKLQVPNSPGLGIRVKPDDVLAMRVDAAGAAIKKRN